MAPCLYPFGKPARASAARAEAEGAGPRDASRGGRVSAPSAPGKHGAGPSSDSTPSASASPPCPFAHLADVWDVDTLRVGPRAEAPEGSAGKAAKREVADGPRTEAESAVVAAAEALRARLLASGAPLRGDPFSPKAQVRAARADKQRARRVFVHDPLSLDRGDIESSSDESEEEDAAAAAASAARRLERAAARRAARAFESVDRRDRAEAHQHALGLALKALAERFETDVSSADVSFADARDAAARRMEDAVGFTLLWCGAAFRVNREHAEKRKTRPALKPPPVPPLGTHLIRRTALDSDPRTRDLYVQDQCSYLYDHAVRTVDHFVDGERQKIYASAKFAFAPRAEARGAAVAVALDPPAPFKWAKAKAPETTHQSETEGTETAAGTETAEGTETADRGSGSDSDSFVFVDPSGDDSANEPRVSRAAFESEGDSKEGKKKGSSDPNDDPNDDPNTLPPDELPPWTRQGTFIELGGCSGHPDYLRRVPKPKREPETYEIERFPALRFERFVKGAPTGRFVGDLVIVCHATNLVANVRFAPYDAAFAEKTGVRGNVVSGSVRAFRERRAVSTRPQKNKKQNENENENERTNSREITQTLRVVLGVTDGDVESCRVVPGRATPDASSNAPSSNAIDENADDDAKDDAAVVVEKRREASDVRCLIRGMAPYSNASRGGFDARDALRSPGLMAQKRFWHAVVDAMHARDLGEPLNSVKYELLHPLRRCAALLILGRDEKYIGAEPKAKTKEDEGGSASRSSASSASPFAPRSTGDDDVGRRMRYEGTFLLAGALPKGSPGPLPRFWTPQPTRRMRR